MLAAEVFLAFKGTYCIRRGDIYLNSPSCSGGGTATVLGEVSVVELFLPLVESLPHTTAVDDDGSSECSEVDRVPQLLLVPASCDDSL